MDKKLNICKDFALIRDVADVVDVAAAKSKSVAPNWRITVLRGSGCKPFRSA